MRQDFDNLKDGEIITLHPNDTNPLHNDPVKATYNEGYFFCEGSPLNEGPDYYLGDVLAYNDGFTTDNDDEPSIMSVLIGSPGQELDDTWKIDPDMECKG